MTDSEAAQRLLNLQGKMFADAIDAGDQSKADEIMRMSAVSFLLKVIAYPTPSGNRKEER